MKTIGIGIQDFAKIADKNMFYIDKTAFLKEWWENQDSVTLITRPRRFGAVQMSSHGWIRFHHRKILRHLPILRPRHDLRPLQAKDSTYHLIFSEGNHRGTAFHELSQALIHLITSRLALKEPVQAGKRKSEAESFLLRYTRQRLCSEFFEPSGDSDKMPRSLLRPRTSFSHGFRMLP